MRYLLVFFVFFSCFESIQAQSKDAWSDLEEAQALLDARKIKEAKIQFEKCFFVFENAGDDLGVSKSAEGWGSALAYAHQNDSALIVLKTGVAAAEKLDGTDPLAQILSVVGVVYQFMGQNEESLKTNLRVAALYRNTPELELYSSRLIHIGNSYQALLEFDSAEYYFREAIRIKEEIKDSQLLHVAYNNAALFYDRARPSYGKAVEYYLKAIESAEAANMLPNASGSLNNLASYLVRQGQYEKGEEYAARALIMVDTLGLKFSKAYVLNTLGSIAQFKGNLDEAEDIYSNALRIFQEYENKPQIAQGYLRLAQVHLKKRNYELAERFVAEGMFLLSEMEERDSDGSFQLLQANILLETGRIDEADPLFRKVYEQAILQNDLRMQEATLMGMSKVAAQIEDFEEAYQLLLEHGMVRDSIVSMEQSKYAAQLEAEYERSKKDEAINNLTYSNQIKDLELSNRKKQIIQLSAGALVALVAAFLGFYLFNVKRRNGQVLEEKNAVIAKALGEKDLLLREIHHRVKNNLQVISSLLSLQSRFIKDPHAISAINEGRSRVRSMALIHQNLYQKENLTGVHIKAYFSKLLQELFDTYRIDNRIELETDIQDLNLDVDTVVPIGLILNELVSNALKYAFPEGEGGILRIRLNEVEGKLLLEVEDNGIGMDDSAKMDKPATFGYLLIRSLAAKLKADIKMYSKNGTLVSLAISEYKNVDEHKKRQHA
ncbi:MAG: tetratricopeptide repeat protein [Saprospiraceae bacterium]|nr:tetratricopeptide repeat protein [Saprospiraceae bacterium]